MYSFLFYDFFVCVSALRWDTKSTSKSRLEVGGRDTSYHLVPFVRSDDIIKFINAYECIILAPAAEKEITNLFFFSSFQKSRSFLFVSFFLDRIKNEVRAMRGYRTSRRVRY